MERARRQGLLATRPNPDPGLDYVSILEGASAAPDGSAVAVRLRYVPDRVVLDAASFGRYLETVGAGAWPSLEAMAAAIMADVSDRAVARWTEVAVETAEGLHPAVTRHGVLLEDRQPKWDNPALLSRLRRH